MNTWLPISRRSHQEIREADRAIIEVLRQQVADAHARYEAAERRHAVEVATLKELAGKAIEVMKPPAPRERSRTLPDPLHFPDKEPELDLTMVDPDDAEAIMLIMRREMPIGHKATAGAVLQRARSIRQQIVEAHERKSILARTPGIVPQNIADRIEAAKNEGVKLAGVA